MEIFGKVHVTTYHVQRDHVIMNCSILSRFVACDVHVTYILSEELRLQYNILSSLGSDLTAWEYGAERMQQIH